MPDLPDQLRITDPRTLRALAHPARQRVILELYSGEVLTASEAAEICGMSPSAMSYHLRALQKAGIVERDESSDGRERPWRAAARSLGVDHAAHAGAGAAIMQSYAGTWGSDLLAGLDRLMARADGEDRGMASRGRVWLTDEEEEQLATAIHALWERYKGRTRSQHPDDAAPRDVYALILPIDDR